MTKTTYRAAASRKLITVLTLSVLAAVAFWIVRLNSSDAPKVSGPYAVYCPTCGKQDTAELAFEGTKFLCPECNEYTASYTDPSKGPPPGIDLTP